MEKLPGEGVNGAVVLDKDEEVPAGDQCSEGTVKVDAPLWLAPAVVWMLK